jgi:uncharacterized RDD family membrane protein YckC
MENTYEPTEHLLDDAEFVDLHQAPAGRRFVNYLVDYGIVYFMWRVVLFKPIVSLMTIVYQRTESRTALYLFSYLLILSWSVLFKTGFEALTNGKTIGKFITGTRAVNEDGSRISAKTALLRSLSRIVPFEAFSALGSPCYPWHDRWTKTVVVDDRLSSLPTLQ